VPIRPRCHRIESRYLECDPEHVLRTPKHDATARRNHRAELSRLLDVLVGEGVWKR
jgi:hypothetical protein